MTQLPIGPTNWSPAGLVHFDRYRADGSIAVLVRGEDGEPYYTASICLPDTPPADSCFWCKDYSENWGAAMALIEAGIAEPTGRQAVAGYEIVDEMRLVVAPRAHVQAYKAYIGEPEPTEETETSVYCDGCGHDWAIDDPCPWH